MLTTCFEKGRSFGFPRNELSTKLHAFFKWSRWNENRIRKTQDGRSSVSTDYSRIKFSVWSIQWTSSKSYTSPTRTATTATTSSGHQRITFDQWTSLRRRTTASLFDLPGTDGTDCADWAMLITHSFNQPINQSINLSSCRFRRVYYSSLTKENFKPI